MENNIVTEERLQESLQEVFERIEDLRDTFFTVMDDLHDQIQILKGVEA